MRKRIRYISIFFIIILLIVSILSMITSSAISFECDVQTYSESIYMINLDSDVVVYEQNPDVQQLPGGLVKIMDFIIASENIDDFDQKIEIKKSIMEYLDEEGLVTSGLYSHAGESLSVTDILYNMILTTGHDSALVLADFICDGDYDAFVKMMNDKAAEMGLENTHFMNCLGIDEKNQYTNCIDMYKLTKYALTLPLFSKIASSTEYYIGKDEEPITTMNYLIDMNRGGDYGYLYATGVKNSATKGAGRCLVSTATYEGYTYMIVAMKAPFNPDDEDDKEYCMMEAADLFRWAFLNLKFVNHVTRDTPICEQKVDHAWNTESILLVPEKDLNIVLPANYNESDITIVPDNTDSVSAPISKGSFITTATVYYKGDKYASIRLVSQDDVALSPILYTTDIIKSILTSIWFLFAVGIVVILFVLYVIISQNYTKKKERVNKRNRK